MSYKRIRDKIIERFGEDCMMEKAGIRCVPIEERICIRGYKKEDDMLEYHHIIPKAKGGKETIENGAVLKKYNHVWLHKQAPDKQRRINRQLQIYKRKQDKQLILPRANRNGKWTSGKCRISRYRYD